MVVGTQHRTYADWIGLEAFDRDNDKIGTIENVYVDTETRRPEWLAIRTGWFGMSSSLAPIVGSTTQDGGIRVDVDKDTVKDAPNVGDGQALDADDERRLYDHYVIDPSGGPDAYTSQERMGRGYTVDRRADEGFEIDSAALTRREEELEVGTRREESGKVRLRKYVTTEQETVTVPVEKERVVVERVPADGTASRSDIGEEVAEVTLHEDKVDASRRVVDKETVRADKERRTENEKVQADLRKERIEVEGDAERR